MNRLTATVIGLLSLVALSAQNAPTRYVVHVDEFQELQIRNGINVIYRCNPDSAGKAVFYATPDMTSRLIFSNPKGKLKIELSKEEKDLDTLRGIPTVTVYSSILTKAENRGDSLLIVEHPSAGPMLKLKVEGNGRLSASDVHVTTLEASVSAGNGEITVWGKCKDAKYSITGKGKILADRLTSTNVRCNLFGSGQVNCFVNGGDITVQGISGATINYRGRPANIKNRSTKAKLVNLDEADMQKPVD